jgi:hypothetical protein
MSASGEEPAGPEADPDLITCDRCAELVPPAAWCIRCGDPLDAEQRRRRHDLASGSARSSFAAAPSEPALAPAVVSTLFPALPRAAMSAFRAILAAGVAVVLALTILGLFPLAIVAAVVLVPLAAVIYVYDVDVYEDEPLPVIGLTLAWGAVTGAAFALAAEEILPRSLPSLGLGLAAEPAIVPLVGRVLVVPLAAGALMALGPAVLLALRRFDDVLDGATFGLASAVAFVGAGALVTSADFLAAGLRPVGDPLPWVARLLGLAVAQPIIAAGAIGGLMGALWLRHRSPVRDRRAIGRLGQPLVAALGAGALLVAQALVLELLEGIVGLLGLAAIALLALAWLRRVIHVGLLQEAREIETGPAEPCPDCGALTVWHTYCGSCGVAFAALPKAVADRRPGEPRPAGPRRAGPRPAQRARLGRRALLALFSGAFAGSLALASALLVLQSRDLDRPDCPDPGLPCAALRKTSGLTGGRGILDAHDGLPFADRAVHVDEMLGFGFEYDATTWEVTEAGDGSVLLVAGGGAAALMLDALDGSLMDADDLLLAKREVWDGALFALARDDDPGRALLGTPILGHRPGHAALLGASVDSALGPDTPVSVALVSARHAGISVVASVLSEAALRAEAFAAADSILATFAWPGEPGTAESGAWRGGTPRARASYPALDALGATPPPARGLTPHDLAVAYGVDALHEAGFRGEGTTVAILQFGADSDEDLAVFDAAFGIEGPPAERIAVGSGLGEAPAAFAEEATLDTQVVRAVAPAARILVYEVPLDVGIAGGIAAIVADDRAQIVSLSYGKCDAPGEWISELERELGRNAIAAAVEAGVTVFAASGDWGAYSCHAFDPTDHRPSVFWPACTDGVVSVGGTYLEVGRGGRHARETGWQDYLSTGGTGGGRNPRDPLPGWQLGDGVTSASEGRRACPDVAAAAAPDTGYLIHFTDPATGEAGWRMIGGTSAAAPFWAASMALVQQMAAAEGIERLGFLGPVLYRVSERRPAAFRDVTRGGNLEAAAVPGWDMATGLGSPDLPVLAEAILEELRS